MFKNQLQELAQRSCFNLPSYSCIREGPDHAPRFKATVNFNGECFESPAFCMTLRQAEHAAAEIALNTLAIRGPSRALAAKVLDETGVYKNLLQETAHRAGLKLPVYTTIRSGHGHLPSYSCTVELGHMRFIGDSAKTKKQAQKNSAMAAWSSLKTLVQQGQEAIDAAATSHEEVRTSNAEQEQDAIAVFLSSLGSSSSACKNLKQNEAISVSGADEFAPATSCLARTQRCWTARHQVWRPPPQEQPVLHLLQLQPIPPPPPHFCHGFQYVRPVASHNSSYVFVPARNKNQAPVLQARASSRVTIRETEKRMEDVEEEDEKEEEEEIIVSSSPSLAPAHEDSNDYASAPELEISKSSPSFVGHSPPWIPVSPRMRTCLLPYQQLPPVISLNQMLGFRSGPRSRFMAPAVRIRSVEPVCSAPPPMGKAPTSSQHEEELAHPSAATSELRHLRI